MPSFTTPARTRWARNNTTGEVGSTLAPGAMEINWPDRKIYVGGTGGTPLLFSQLIRDYSSAISYKVGDLALYDGNLIRAIANTGGSAAPAGGDWEIVLGETQGFIYEAVLTGLLEGGTVTAPTGTSVAISGGRGLIVDNREVEVPDIAEVSWGGFTSPVSDPGENWSLVGMDATASIVHVPASSVDFVEWRRNNILLGALLWDGATISRVVDLSAPPGQTSETLRDAYYAQGGAFRARGLRMAHVDGGYKLSFSAGAVFAMGSKWRTTPQSPNVVNVGAIAEATFAMTTRDGIETASTTSVDNANYDNGGVVTAIPAGRYAIHYVTATPDFSSIYVQYGQDTYASAFGAAEALADDWEALVPFAGSELLVLCGACIVGPDDASFTTGRVINALNEPTPFIGTIAQETSGFLLTDGTRAMAGDLDMAGFDIVDGGDAALTSVTGATIQSRSIVWA